MRAGRPWNGTFSSARVSQRRPTPEALAEVYELFPRLAERRKQPARTLSGGEQQMLAMGRALVLDPVLLIADEVSLGLAPVIVDRIFDVMTAMNRRGRGVLLAEQNVRVSLEAATRAYVLDAGRVGLEGPAADLWSDPRIVRVYLQEFCAEPRDRRSSARRLSHGIGIQCCPRPNSSSPDRCTTTCLIRQRA